LKTLVTGANGFIGSKLCTELYNRDINVSSISRNNFNGKIIHLDIDGNTNWVNYIQDIDCIIHTANIAHESLESQKMNQLKYQAVNIDGTLNLARQAIEAGVRRFIYISSISVIISSETRDSGVLDEKTIVSENNLSIYARSKLIAEKQLIQLTKNVKMDLIIVRPPMVYGESLLGNFGSLVKILKSRIPIPFGSLQTVRSFIYIGNLTNFLITLIEYQDELNEIFLISDGADIRVKSFIKKVAQELQVKIRMIPFPIFLLRMIIKTFIRGKGLQLLDSFRVDITKAKRILNWHPPFKTDEAIRKSCQNLIETKGK
jgi:nucleoside-diphosphate-sugar epimerase